MSAKLLIETALAGFAYVISPGPAFLAIFALGARSGRSAGGRFLLGHSLGDVLWTGLAIAGLVGASRLGSTLFDVLGLCCGAYLVVLGWRALTRASSPGTEPIASRRPWLNGILFGLTNPKAYPVATAMFAAIALPSAGALGWADAPKLVLAAICGFLPAYGILLYAAGLPAVRQLFMKHGVVLTRAVGALFLLFGLRTLWDAGHGLTARR